MLETKDATSRILYFRRFSSVKERNEEHWIAGKKAKDTSDLLNQVFGHAMHYGTTVFDGSRAKTGPDGKLAIVNFDLNAARFVSSMKSLYLAEPTFTPDDIPPEFEKYNKEYHSLGDIYIPSDFNEKKITEIAIECIQRNAKEGLITPTNGEIYVRPFAYRSSHPKGELGVYSLKHDVVFALMILEWGDYLPPGLTLRVHSNGMETPSRCIKTGSNYGYGSIIKHEAVKNGLSDGLITDTDHERNILEATGANFFIFEDEDTLITPPLGPYLLAGITRRTTIELARNLGLTVREEPIPLERLADIHAGFLTGTATGLRSIGFIYDPTTRKGYELNSGYGPLNELQKEFENVIKGLQVSSKNERLQQRVRSIVVPLN